MAWSGTSILQTCIRINDRNRTSPVSYHDILAPRDSRPHWAGWLWPSLCGAPDKVFTRELEPIQTLADGLGLLRGCCCGCCCGGIGGCFSGMRVASEDIRSIGFWRDVHDGLDRPQWILTSMLQFDPPLSRALWPIVPPQCFSVDQDFWLPFLPA